MLPRLLARDAHGAETGSAGNCWMSSMSATDNAQDVFLSLFDGDFVFGKSAPDRALKSDKILSIERDHLVMLDLGFYGSKPRFGD